MTDNEAVILLLGKLDGLRFPLPYTYRDVIMYRSEYIKEVLKLRGQVLELFGVQEEKTT